MPIYELIEYDKLNNCHVVKDEAGVTRLVDVMVNGDFPEGTDPISIVGQKVAYEYEYPYIAIAMRVQRPAVPEAGPMPPEYPYIAIAMRVQRL